MIVTAFLKALGQLGDPRFRGVLWRGVGLALLLLAAFSALFVWAVGWIVGDAVTIPWVGTVDWADTVLSWAMVPLTLVLSVFLMVPVASAITSMFLEEVAQAVEDVHYPSAGTAPAVPLVDAFLDSLGFLGVMLAANLLALVLYLFLVPLAPFIFWGLNGFLLGREYITVAAMRRMGRQEARRLWRRNLPVIWAAGVLMALPLSVPVVNLLVPVIGAATFTHIFHRLPSR